MQEKRLSLIAPAVVGALLVLESAAMLCLAVSGFVIGGFVGALAFLAGGGSATNEQLAQGFLMMAITLVSPFVVAAVLVVGGVLLLLRRRRRVIIAVGVFAVTAQFAFHPFFGAGFHAAELVPGALHLLAIAVGFAFVPAPVAIAASA
jgi:hypothetical protein